MVKKPRLSQKDVEDLLKNPDVKTKSGIVDKIAGHYQAEGFTAQQVEIAENIFRLVMDKAEQEVRKVLADNIMHSRQVPKDIILSMARDVAEISCPVLETSEILTDRDLVQIIQGTEESAKLSAIAKRKNVSEIVSDALIEKKKEDVISDLLQNKRADILDVSYEKIVNNFPNNELLVESMMTREAISGELLQKITSRISENIQRSLEEKYHCSLREINLLFKESAEIAAIRFEGRQSIDEELVSPVDKLEGEGKLVETLRQDYSKLCMLLQRLELMGKASPLSTLAQGNLTLFAISMSRRTGVPYSNVLKLLGDAKGFKGLYERAKLPPLMYEPAQLALTVAQEMEEKFITKGTPRARDSLTLFAERLTDASIKGKPKNILHFIAIIRDHIQAQKVAG